jgi:hypothetical protein
MPHVKNYSHHFIGNEHEAKRSVKQTTWYLKGKNRSFFPIENDTKCKWIILQDITSGNGVMN